MAGVGRIELQDARRIGGLASRGVSRLGKYIAEYRLCSCVGAWCCGAGLRVSGAQQVGSTGGHGVVAPKVGCFEMFDMGVQVVVTDRSASFGSVTGWGTTMKDEGPQILAAPL